MILSIGKFSYKLIFPFLYAICTFLKTLTYSKGELKNPYVTLLFFSLAQLSMGILEIITQLRLKNVRILILVFIIFFILIFFLVFIFVFVLI